MEQLNVKTITDFGLRLNSDCWEIVLSYLDVGSQVQLANASEYVCNVFKEYGKRCYKHIDDNLLANLTQSSFINLLQLIGDHVLSYTRKNSYDNFFGDPESLCNDDNDEVNLLKITMVEIMYRMHIESIVENCKQLEKFNLELPFRPSNVPYELICQLPKLKHIWLKEARSLRPEFVDSLMAWQGVPLEKLLLVGSLLSRRDMQIICRIVSLKELYVHSIEVPIQQFLKLRQLEKLYVRHVDNSMDKLFEMIKGLPHLNTLHIGCIDITDAFVQLVNKWFRENGRQRPKLEICYGTNTRVAGDMDADDQHVTFIDLPFFIIPS